MINNSCPQKTTPRLFASWADENPMIRYSPKSGEMILTVHRWFTNKSCPGNWMYARMGDLAEKVTKALQGSSDSGKKSDSEGDVLPPPLSRKA